MYNDTVIIPSNFRLLPKTIFRTIENNYMKNRKMNLTKILRNLLESIYPLTLKLEKCKNEI